MARPPNPTSKLACAIRQAREAARLTQTELATEVGVSAGLVAQWETGRATPGSDCMERLAAALRVPVWGLDHARQLDRALELSTVTGAVTGLANFLVLAHNRGLSLQDLIQNPEGRARLVDEHERAMRTPGVQLVGPDGKVINPASIRVVKGDS